MHEEVVREPATLVREMTRNAVYAERAVVYRELVKGGIAPLGGALFEGSVTVAAILVPKRPVHAVGLLEPAANVPEGVLGGEQLHPRASHETGATVTVDAAERAVLVVWVPG